MSRALREFWTKLTSLLGSAAGPLTYCIAMARLSCTTGVGQNFRSAS